MAKCLYPKYLKSAQSVIPCGKCVNCRQNKRQAWIYRLQMEAEGYPFSLFVTLTYDDEHLPVADIGSDLFSGHVAVVSKRDVQLFMKRLRRKYEDYKMRYFVTSEYGAQGGRPHYHMILFGFPFTGKKAGDLLCECWQNGFVQAHPLTVKEVAYVCKYMYEKSMVPEVLKDAKAYYPFMLCSRNPGIGFRKMTEDIIDFYRRHPRDYVRAWNGYRMAMPRYYVDMLYDDDMKMFLRQLRKAFWHEKMYKQWHAWLIANPAERWRLDMDDMERQDQIDAYQARREARMKVKEKPKKTRLL